MTTLKSDVLGREAERIHARINDAPVTEWVKSEARIELNRLVKIADDLLYAPAVADEMEAALKVEDPEVASVNPPDLSWRRMQIVEAILHDRQPVSTESIIERARAIENYVQNG